LNDGCAVAILRLRHDDDGSAAHEVQDAAELRVRAHDYPVSKVVDAIPNHSLM
jgi:hypothetical protein